MSTPSLTLEIPLPDLSPDAIRAEVIRLAVARICGGRSVEDDDRDGWSSELHAEIRKEVVAAVRPAIDAEVARIVVARLDERFQPTTHWGQPEGKPTTLREMIGGRLDFWLTEKTNREGTASPGYHDRNQELRSRLVWIVEDRVEAVFKAGLSVRVAEAAKAVQDRLTVRVGHEVAAAVAKLLQLPAPAPLAPADVSAPPVPPAPVRVLRPPDAPAAPPSDDDVGF